MAREKTWKPALNSDNRAFGRFDGVYGMEFFDKDANPYERIEAIFMVLGSDNQEKSIPVLMSPKYDPKNSLGLLGKAFGFEYKPEYKENEHGFKILESDNLDELDEIIEENEGKNFTFKLTQKPDKPGLWEIDLPSIREFKSESESESDGRTKHKFSKE